MQFYVPQLSNACRTDLRKKFSSGAPMLELEIDEIRYDDSKKVSKTHQAYHIISERIITRTSQNKRYDGIRKG